MNNNLVKREDKNFLASYFDALAKLIDPKTGQPRNREAHLTRQEMRAELRSIRRKYGDETLQTLWDPA